MPRSSSREQKGSCGCCGGLISLGLSGFTLWLVFSFYNPILSIENFHVPALNKSLNTTTNNTISFDLKLKNRNLNKGIRYSNLNLTFSYVQNVSINLSIANFSIPSFYQGHRKTAHRIDTIEASGVQWEEARNVLAGGSLVYFRVDLKTRVRYTTTLWIKKRKTIMVGKTLEVNDAGEMVKKGGKGVKLSAAPVQVSYGVGLAFFCFSLFL